MEAQKTVPIVVDGEDYHQLVGSGAKNSNGVGLRTGLGQIEVQLKNYVLELKESVYYSRFGNGIMFQQKLYHGAAGIIFCVGPTDGSNLQYLQGVIRKQTSEWFLRQAPVLIFYNYTSAPRIWDPEELGRRLEIDTIGSDNEWKVFAWRKNLIDECHPGFQWLEQALDRYFAKVLPESRAFKNHPLITKHTQSQPQPQHHHTDPVAHEQVKKELQTSTDARSGPVLSYEDTTRVSLCSII